jgi:hypothetical protein
MLVIRSCIMCSSGAWQNNVYSNIYPTRCNVTQFILSGNCSTCFGWYHHPSSGAQITVSTASVICHTVTTTCRYRGRVGTGLSVLWVAYATHSTLKLIPGDKKKSLCTWRLQSPHNWWFKDGHHKIHSECGPCYTEHGLREHTSAYQ